MTDRFTRSVYHEVGNRHFTCRDERGEAREKPKRNH